MSLIATRDWLFKNVGGIVMASVGAVFLYGLGAFISTRITTEMRNYVPLQVWSQWAQERGEWRGGVDQRLKNLEQEMYKQRDEILKELRDNAKLVAVQTQMISDLREQLKMHMTTKDNGFP